MKDRIRIRLLAVPLLTVLFLVGAPLVEAAVINWPVFHSLKDKKKDDHRDKERVSVPEGSVGAALVLTASVLGGGLLISRRKRRANRAA